jgi:hypothetical protein
MISPPTGEGNAMANSPDGHDTLQWTPAPVGVGVAAGDAAGWRLDEFDSTPTVVARRSDRRKAVAAFVLAVSLIAGLVLVFLLGSGDASAAGGCGGG